MPGHRFDSNELSETQNQIKFQLLAVRDDNLNAFIRTACGALVAVDILCVRIDGRRVEFGISMDGLRGTAVESEDERRGEEVH